MWRRENNADWNKKYKQYMKKYQHDWFFKNHKVNLSKNKATRHTKRDPNNPLTYKDVLTIYEQCDYTCQYCFKKNLEGNDLTLEHITPISQGGTNKLNNVTVACLSCNSRKLFNKGIKPQVMQID